MKTLLLAVAFLTLPGITLAQNPAPTNTYLITGTIHSATTGQPIPQAHLSAIPSDFKPCPGTSYSTIEAEASPEGTFRLPLPCPTIWRLAASAPGYSEQYYQQHENLYTGIVLTPTHPTFDLQFDLIPPASISGLIRDEAGEPVRSARVKLLSANLAAVQLLPNSTTFSDDRGFYEFSNVLPGNYLIGVSAQPWYAMGSTPELHPNAADPSLDLTYPFTYFPSANDAPSATVLTVAPGQQLQADVHLIPIPALHLLIPSANPAPTPLQDLQSRRQPGNRPNNMPNPVPAVTLITPFGQEPVNLTHIANNPDGSIELSGLAPGDYRLVQYSQRREPTQQLTQERTQQLTQERTITLKSDPSRTTTLSTPPNPPAANPNLKLSGTTTFDSKPAAGALLLLVAATTPDSTGHFKLLRAQSNTDGSFTFYRIPPGNYILVAIQSGWALPWTDPATLSPYLLNGTPIQLTHSITLQHPIPAQ